MGKKSVQDIIIGSLITTGFAVAGFWVFESFKQLVDLSSLAIGWQLLIGLLVIVTLTKIGLDRYAN